MLTAQWTERCSTQECSFTFHKQTVTYVSTTEWNPTCAGRKYSALTNLTQYLQVNQGRTSCGHVVANCQRNCISFVCCDHVALSWRVVCHICTEICTGETKKRMKYTIPTVSKLIH